MRIEEDAMGVMVSATLLLRAPTTRFGRAEKESQAWETLYGVSGQKMAGIWFVVTSAMGGSKDAGRGRVMHLCWRSDPYWLKDRRDRWRLSCLRPGWPESRVFDGDLASAVVYGENGGCRVVVGWTRVPARVPGGEPPWDAAWSNLVGRARMTRVVVDKACGWCAAMWAWAAWASRNLNMQRPACACRGAPLSTLDNLGFLISFTYIPRCLVYLPPSCFQSRSCGGVIRDLR
jgi:hypothetical protein